MKFLTVKQAFVKSRLVYGVPGEFGETLMSPKSLKLQPVSDAARASAAIMDFFIFLITVISIFIRTCT